MKGRAKRKAQRRAKTAGLQSNSINLGPRGE